MKQKFTVLIKYMSAKEKRLKEDLAIKNFFSEILKKQSSQSFLIEFGSQMTYMFSSQAMNNICLDSPNY